MVYEISSTGDLNSLLSSYKVLVVKIYATWCNPCKLYAPKFVEVETNFSSKEVGFAQCDIESNIINGISAVPATIVYVNGNLYETIMGAKIKDLTTLLESLNAGGGASSGNTCSCADCVRKSVGGYYGNDHTNYTTNTSNNSKSNYSMLNQRIGDYSNIRR